MADEKPPRARSPVWDDARRAEVGARHRTPERGIPVPERWDGPDTSEIEDPDARQVAREQRPDRVGHLETRVDGVVKSLSDWRAESAQQMGDVNASIGELAGEVRGLATVIKTDKDREHVKFTNTVEFDKAAAIVQVKDSADAKKHRRERITLIVKGVFGGGVVLELIHRLFL